MHLYRVKIQFIVQPRAIGSQPNNFSPMKNKELRWFEYDASPFEQCQLDPPSTVLKIQIKKYKRKNKESNMGLPKVPKGAIRFRTWKIGNGNGKWGLYSDCHPGFIDIPVIARDGMLPGPQVTGCGIGTILIKLCMNEKTIHNAIRNNKNTALKSLRPEFKNTMNWMKSHCSKVVMFKTTNNDASMFLLTAERFGFTIMVIKRKLTTEAEVLYPKAGPCSIYELGTHYKDGIMNIDGEPVRVTGENNVWYFCHPTSKIAEDLPQCK